MSKPQVSNERRRFTRILLDVTVQFEHDNMLWSSELIDISLKGALIERPSDWNGKKGDIYQLDIHLDQDISITMDAKAVHVDDHAIGFECTVIDITSITTLRRVVELNLGSAELLNRELHALGESGQ